MKTKEQKVETYDSLSVAQKYITAEIDNGWLVHSVSTLTGGFTRVLVIFEKDLETWN